VNLVGIAGILSAVAWPRRIDGALEIVAEKSTACALPRNGVVAAPVLAFSRGSNFGGAGICRIDRFELVLSDRDVLFVGIVDDAAVLRTRRALASVEVQSFDLLQIAEGRFWIVLGSKQTVDQIDVLGRVR